MIKKEDINGLVSYKAGFSTEDEIYVYDAKKHNNLMEDLSSDELKIFIEYLEEYFRDTLKEADILEEGVQALLNSGVDWNNPRFANVYSEQDKVLKDFYKEKFTYNIGNIALLSYFNEPLYYDVKRYMPDYISIDFHKFGKVSDEEPLFVRIRRGLKENHDSVIKSINEIRNNHKESA